MQMEREYSRVKAMGSGQEPLRIDDHRSALELAISVQCHLPGPRAVRRTVTTNDATTYLGTRWAYSTLQVGTFNVSNVVTWTFTELEQRAPTEGSKE